MNTRFALLATCILPLAFLSTRAVAADFADRNVKVSYVVPKDHPYGAGVAKFTELVASKTGGKMKVRGYADGQLGAEVQSISAAKGGVIEMAIVSTAAAATTIKDFGLFDLPYLFNDYKEADAVLDGPVGTRTLEKLQGSGLVGLCYWENGFRNVTNSRRSISKLEDFKGLKIRTIQNPVFIDVFNTLGANATPLAFTEVYTALESRAIDGQETPYNSIYTSRFFEVQKYVSETRHIYGAAVVLVGKRFWDGLNSDERKMLQESCYQARDYERRFNREQDPKLLTSLKAKGMQYNDLTDAERARIRTALKPVYDKHSKLLGEDTYKQITVELEKVRLTTR
ncbi:TRAP transporter substrate-binding protein [Cupriavidus sp. P-10]|uniref:TRAP transporter substrate-binding protein n=1 Tax=Cupriavidus sp. P-10 TaxID=2027911 RepID=UPI000EDF9B38|nr:TRAP transporter substrate-binding protein [Cupriavidus sp. P-10]BDB27283.1 TRAP transporter substrate-binding protein [Cupriavidus sp. P-10]